MSKQDFALDATAEHRITIHWTTEIEPATVFINGTLSGTLTTVEEKIVGKDFTLPDHSLLHVQFFNGQPQAFRSGTPLAPVAGVADVYVKQRKRSGCLTTWLILNLVVIAALTVLNFLATFGTLVSNRVSTPPLAFLLLGLMGIVGVVGISLLLAWKKQGFYLVVGYVLIDIIISVIFGFVDIRTFTPLIGIVVLYAWLNRSNVWDNLD
jgi:hypothetical protein